MQLIAPSLAPKVYLTDIDGEPVDVHEGRLTLLSFFRDAACPFCNIRIFELTQRHDDYAALGLDVVAVFASSPEKVKHFILARPRPFRVAAEPSARAYEIYGIRRSFWRKLWAIIARFPTALRGLKMVGPAGLVANNMMPADFLIDETGQIVEAYYGRDAGDRIPLEHIELFLARSITRRRQQEQAEAQTQ